MLLHARTERILRVGIDHGIVLNDPVGSGDTLRNAHVGATVNHLRALANDIHPPHLPTLMHVVLNPAADVTTPDVTATKVAATKVAASDMTAAEVAATHMTATHMAPPEAATTHVTATATATTHVTATHMTAAAMSAATAVTATSTAVTCESQRLADQGGT